MMARPISWPVKVKVEIDAMETNLPYSVSEIRVGREETGYYIKNSSEFIDEITRILEENASDEMIITIKIGGNNE